MVIALITKISSPFRPSSLTQPISYSILYPGINHYVIDREMKATRVWENGKAVRTGHWQHILRVCEWDISALLSSASRPLSGFEW